MVVLFVLPFPDPAFVYRDYFYKKEAKLPVTMATRPVPSTPFVTCSAVERAENPELLFNPNIHISLLLKFLITKSVKKNNLIQNILNLFLTH